MPTAVRWGSLILAALLVGCGGPPPARDGEPPPPAPAASSNAQIPAARRLLRSFRERPPATPARPREQRCDAPAFERLSGAERELSLRVVDARPDTRPVLPLRITSRLTEPDLSELDAVLAGIEQPEARPRALQIVETLASRRFVGVYHVVHYASPKWVVRAGHAKPSWEAGRLDAWLMVHDAKTGDALCGTRIAVLGHAQGAPRAVRLRSDTREQLQTALGERLRESTRAALARLGGELVVPSAGDLALAQR
jgi:hypothetical protein